MIRAYSFSVVVVGVVVIAVVAFAVGVAGCPGYHAPLCTGALCTAFPVGAEPNAVKLARCDGKPVAVVAESGPGRISTYSLPDGKSLQSIIVTDDDPFGVAIDDVHGRALVTLRATDSLALVDPCTGEVLEVPKITGAHQPQAVVFDGTRFYVAFTNITHDGTGPTDPTSADPGVVAAFDTSGDALTPGPSIALPCKDPQGLVVDGAHVWASCTGPLAPGAAGETPSEDGALVELDFAAAAVVATVTAARTAPGTPAVIGGLIYAGSDVAPVLLSAATADGGALTKALSFDGPAVDSVFQVVSWDATHLLASQFSADAIRVVDVGQTPPALVDTVQAGPGGPAFRGVVAFDARPGFGDVDAVAVLTLSAEVVPLRLHTLACCGAAP